MRHLFNWLTSPRQVRRVFERVFRVLGLRPSSGSGTLADARRVLIVRLDHIGDLILTSPFLREIRRSLPGSEITLLVTPECRPIVEHCPYVDHVVVHARFRPAPFGRVRRIVQEISFSRNRLWPRHFDLAVVPRWDTQLFREGFLAYLSGARMRVGFEESGNTVIRNDDSYACLYTHLAPSGSHMHEVEKYLALLQWMGGSVVDTRTEVWLAPEDRAYALEKMPALPRRVRVAMVPGSSSSGRRWPSEKFAEIASWMVQDLGWEVVLIGAPGEVPLGRAVEEACSEGVVNLIGQTSVRQTIALLERCQLYVGNDTGPMHMASAVGVPSIEISCHPADGQPDHERSPLRFGAWGVQSWVAQPAQGSDGCVGFCARGETGEAHCILAVTADQVKQLVLAASDSCRLQKDKILQ